MTVAVAVPAAEFPHDGLLPKKASAQVLACSEL